MIVVKIIFLLVIGFAIINYPKWSYNEFYKRSEINEKHPDWKPYCGINFLEEDPQWFRNNGYGKWVD